MELFPPPFAMPGTTPLHLVIMLERQAAGVVRKGAPKGRLYIRAALVDPALDDAVERPALCDGAGEQWWEGGQRSIHEVAWQRQMGSEQSLLPLRHCTACRVAAVPGAGGSGIDPDQGQDILAPACPAEHSARTFRWYTLCPSSRGLGTAPFSPEQSSLGMVEMRGGSVRSQT